MARRGGDVAKWQGVAQLALKFGLELQTVPGAGAAVDLLATLIGLQSEQAEALGSIKADTNRLRLAPLRTATTYLDEARRIGVDDPRHEQYLDKATDHLFAARSLADSAQERALVELQLTVIANARGRAADARHWVSLCARSTRDGLEEVVARAQDALVQAAASEHLDVVDARGGGDVRTPTGPVDLTITWLSFFSVAGRRTMSGRKRDRVRALLQYLTFHNTVLGWERTLVGADDQADLGLFWDKDRFDKDLVVLARIGADRVAGLPPVALDDDLGRRSSGGG